jgi:protoporphyrinogen oxidase
MKRIVCLGGGPAGLYSAILLRKALPAARIEVYERNRPDDTFGWGVVFSDETMGNFRAADPETHGAIIGNFHHWDDIAIHFGGRKLVSGGHGFCGIGRKKLLQILQERAHELGVQQSFSRDLARSLSRPARRPGWPTDSTAMTPGSRLPSASTSDGGPRRMAGAARGGFHTRHGRDRTMNETS